MVRYIVVMKSACFISVLFFPLILNALNIQSTLNDMISHNPDILQKRQELLAAQHELQIANSGYLPKLDIRSSVAKERANTQMTGFENRSFKTLNTNIVLTQNLFAGFETDSDTAIKQHNIETKSHELKEKINDLSLRMIKSYLDVVKTSELLEVERDNVKVHEEIYRKITLKVESGSGRIGDHKEVLAKLALCYVNTLTQDNNYNDAAAVLHTVMGKYLEVRDLDKPTIDPLAVPKSLEEAIQEAIQKNPALLVSRSEIESAKKLVDLERSSYYPKVNAELNARSYDNANGTENTDKSASAMVTLSYNLYNGGSDEARIKRSLSQTYNAIEHYRAVERAVAEKMVMAYNAYTVFNRQKPFLEVYRDASFQKTDYYQEEFDLGRRSLIDLLESENEYSTARRKAVENEYELLYSFFRVLAAKNELITYFKIETEQYPSKNYTCINSEKSDFDLNHAPSVGNYPPIVTKRADKINMELPIKQENHSSIDTLEKTTPQKGYENYLKSARLGDSQSQCMMVYLYEQGIGTAKNREKALYWQKRCAQKPQAEPLSLPQEKSKSLDERLRELGILLNESKKQR